MAFKVLGASVSPFVRKVRAFLAEKGLAYEHEPVSPFSPPEGWRSKSPLGKIPAFEHDGRVLADSSVICAYLERVHPDPALYPRDAYDYARALWFEEFADGGISPVSGPGVIQPLVLRPFLTRSAPDEGAAKKAIEEGLPPLFDYLERELRGREFLVGDRLSIADIGVATQFVSLRLAGVKPDPGRWPELSGFLGRIHARPSFARLIEEDRAGPFGKRFA
jgi:glutathione S-transferase